MGQYIVLDLEWNQSPLGKDGSMDRLPFEIIEIGAVKLNASLQIISEFRRLIRPRVYRQMHFKKMCIRDSQEAVRHLFIPFAAVIVFTGTAGNDTGPD